MEKTEYLILGGGPAGVTFASRLKEFGIEDFLVLEMESEAGGLCRSTLVDGFPLDIGGGHFLDVRRPKVNDFLFNFMPESEWDKYDRNSKIAIHNMMINHPFEANIWQMPTDEQVVYLKSIAIAGCNIGKKMPEDFIEWIHWKLGDKIANDYMIPYNQKMFGNELSELGTYWLEKLPDVSFEETLLSCLEKKAYGKQPGHAQFYYPKKYGYGELWRRMADSLDNKIHYNSQVSVIDYTNKIVKLKNGETYQANYIISTIPWNSIDELFGMPEEIEKTIKHLKHSSIQIEYFNKNLETDCHWIYYPDPQLPYHRILVRSNFCPGSRGHWTETNINRVKFSETSENYKYVNQYAYPINTKNKPNIMKKLLEWNKSQNVYGLGRWGEHQHYNSDATVEKAMSLADSIIRKR